MTSAIPVAAPHDATHDSRTSHHETTGLSSFGVLAEQLNHALSQLCLRSSPLQMPPLDSHDWFNLLVRKLLPQLSDDAYLIVAVVGGTNIGKSVVFNHIAGFRASASCPLASGTKHPVCLVPDGFGARHDLQALFPAFELRPWVDSDEALAGYAEHCLFWRTSSEVPANLVILDTPDVDSDAPVNWQRADAVRQAADVLVAVLTQQKYNDAAVKQFFRKAATEDKAALIVFNQVELPDDEPYWPLWLNTFCGETGLQPEFVYLAQNDRKAAEAIRLKFEERTWPINGHQADGHQANIEIRIAGEINSATNVSMGTPVRDEPQKTDEPVHLSSVLSQLRFSEIKLRTLRGSLQRLIADADGAPAYLREIRNRSEQFHRAADLFASRSLIRHADWPAPPNSLIVDEMWLWWDGHREVWTSGIHGFYANIGRWMTGGVQLVRNRIWGPPVPPLDDYRHDEWNAIVRVLEQVFEQLRLITTLGNELLTSRLDPLLAGTTCESILAKMHREHDEFDFKALIHSLVESEMSNLKSDRQRLFEILRNADRAAAIARPVLTLLLAIGGGFGAEQFLTHAATQSMTHVAIDATAAAGTTAAGEAVVETASGALGQVKAWLLNLHQKFKAKREEWLTEKLTEHLLGDLPAELQTGASIPNSSEYQAVVELVRQFEIRLTAAAPNGKSS